MVAQHSEQLRGFTFSSLLYSISFHSYLEHGKLNGRYEFFYSLSFELLAVDGSAVLQSMCSREEVAINIIAYMEEAQWSDWGGRED